MHYYYTCFFKLCFQSGAYTCISTEVSLKLSWNLLSFNSKIAENKLSFTFLKLFITHFKDCKQLFAHNYHFSHSIYKLQKQIVIHYSWVVYHSTHSYHLSLNSKFVITFSFTPKHSPRSTKNCKKLCFIIKHFCNIFIYFKSVQE